MLGFNYYFLPPVGTFTIQDPQNWVALLAFLVTAVTASQLSARERRRAAESEERRLEIERLYALVQAMMLSGSVRKTIQEFVHKVVQVFGCNAAAFYYQPADEIFRSGPESHPVTDGDLHAVAEGDDISIDPARGTCDCAGAAGRSADGKRGAAREAARGPNDTGDRESDCHYD